MVIEEEGAFQVAQAQGTGRNNISSQIQDGDAAISVQVLQERIGSYTKCQSTVQHR